MGLKRWFRHVITDTWTVKRTFPPEAMLRIRDAIAHVEEGAAGRDVGELRFVVEGALPWSYLRRGLGTRPRAVMLFGKLRVWDTESNNGVLLYLNLADRQVEIVADRGIARAVPQAEWDRVCMAMRDAFARRQFSQGVLAGIADIGTWMATAAPVRDAPRHANELPNEPVVL
jgi:uncharacterized membrane protein